MLPLYLDVYIYKMFISLCLLSTVQVLHVLGQADRDGHPSRLLPVLSQPLHLQEDQVLNIINISIFYINDVHN